MRLAKRPSTPPYLSLLVLYSVKKNASLKGIIQTTGNNIQSEHVRIKASIMNKILAGVSENQKSALAYQLRSNCEDNQRLCFRYTDSTIPLLAKSENSSL